MPVVLHGFMFYIIMSRILHYLRLFIDRFLVMDLGVPYPIAPILAFVIIGVIIAFAAKYLHL